MLLLFLPFFHLGQNNDLVMCCSIPGLFVVMICTIRYMFEFPKTAATGALVVLLFIGAINPLKEMRGVMGELWREGVGSSIGASTLATYSNLKDEDIPIIKYNYYSYNIDKNIFIKYIAKHAWE